MSNKDDRTFLSEFFSESDKRTATIYSRWTGTEVDLLVDGKVVGRRVLDGHDRQYAEDICEDWVQGHTK